MEMKVVKFGGSSLADANQFRRVAAIVTADPARRYVVASAPGKRFKDDVKVTDMFYHCYELVRQGKNITEYYAQICDRYNSIIEDLGLDFDISGELDYIRNAIEHYSGQDFAASRGEYLNSLILAKFLKFDFIDAESVIYFRENGTFDEEKTNMMMREELKSINMPLFPAFMALCPTAPLRPLAAVVRISQDRLLHVPLKRTCMKTGPTFRAA